LSIYNSAIAVLPTILIGISRSSLFALDLVNFLLRIIVIALSMDAILVYSIFRVMVGHRQMIVFQYSYGQ
jgi:hypothetical protein